DARVPGVVRLDGDDRPAAAVLQAVRLVDHHALGQAALAQHVLQAIDEFLAALLPARALRISRRTGVDADEQLTLRVGQGYSVRASIPFVARPPRSGARRLWSR